MRKFIKRKENRSTHVPKIIAFYALHERACALVFLVIAILIPLIVNQRYVTNILTNCAIYSVLALSLNLVAGFMNNVSLGHAAFYGIGAYTAAILSTKLGWSFPATFLAAFLLTGLAGLLVGVPTLRIKGKYLPIITMGFCEIIRIVEYNWDSLTRGPMGIPNIPTFSLFGVKLNSPFVKYMIILVILLITIVVVCNIVNSRIGRAVTTIREDETAASFMGINVFRYKLLVFCISAAFAGVAGAFYAHHITFIDPKLYTFDQSILILSMLILGGMGSVPGSIVGAIILSALPELLRDFVEYRQVVYGALIVIMVIVRPNGMLGAYNMKHIRQQLGAEKNAAVKGGQPE